jgi:hypothetical protein
MKLTKITAVNTILLKGLLRDLRVLHGEINSH